MQFTPLGDRAVTITLGRSIDEPTHRLVRAVSAVLDDQRPSGVVDLVPAFASVTVHYDPSVVTGESHLSPYSRIVATLKQVLFDIHPEETAQARVVEIPVCYGGELGPDLGDVARRHSLDTEDVIRIHTGGDYLVYMVGFMPGFAYLGGLPAQIATPRRASPRGAVPAGTVGIGGQQTGVYPLESPGGWNLIGRTPLRIFDITRDEPTLLAQGDRVRFRSISLNEFHRLSEAS